MVPKNGFVGWYGHSYLDDGDMDLQFRIVAHDGTLYAVAPKGWNTGRWYSPMLMSAEQLLKCDIYRTEAEWTEEGERVQAALIRKEERAADQRQRKRIAERRAALIAEFG